jgi:hypothetical protein
VLQCVDHGVVRAGQSAAGSILDTVKKSMAKYYESDPSSVFYIMRIGGYGENEL